MPTPCYPWAEVEPVRDASVRNLCVRPYPGHPGGCPNYGKRPSCPPRAPMLKRLIRLSDPVYVVWNQFDLGTHCEVMRQKHPDWTERQVRCCLYWQPKARKELRVSIAAMHSQMPWLLTVMCPEACGVDITATMARVGIEIEWPPVKWAYQVALAGTPHHGRGQLVYAEPQLFPGSREHEGHEERTGR